MAYEGHTRGGFGADYAHGTAPLPYVAIHGELPPTEDTLTVIASARLASRRLCNSLMQPEVNRETLADGADGAGDAEGSSDLSDDLAICIPDRSFCWTRRDDVPPTLKAIDLRMPRGELWVLVGELGSGKSSVLAAILGALCPVDDALCTKAVVQRGTSGPTSGRSR